jgi:hypothetical protein
VHRVHCQEQHRPPIHKPLTKKGVKIMTETMKETKREIPSISIIAHPQWTGTRTNTDKRFPDKSAKYSLSVPVPTTDEEAQTFYGVSLTKLIEAGVVQGFYSASDIDNVIKEAHSKGTPADDTDLMSKVLAAAEGTTFTARERVSIAKEIKTLKAEIAGSGMSIAEAIALLKELKSNK